LRRSARQHRGRTASLALLGALALLISARPGQAAGCHAEERPEFGLSRGLDASSLRWTLGHLDDLPDAPTRVAPRPCHGETPSVPGHVPDATGSADSGDAVRLSKPDPRPDLLAAEEAPLHPRHRSETPHRPPRSHARSA
jgi:hypothetical protein